MMKIKLLPSLFFCFLLIQATYAQIENIDLGGGQNLAYNLGTGEATYTNGNGSITDFYAEVHLGNQSITSKMYTSRSYSEVGQTAVILLTDPSLPSMKQVFTRDNNDQIRVAVSLEDDSNVISSNYMAPIVAKGTGVLNVGTGGANIRTMRMPSFQPNTQRWNYPSINSSGISYNVTTFYDADTKNGFIIGAITHVDWKSGINYSGSNNKLDDLEVVSGVKNEWDAMEHGEISGTKIKSAVMLLGYYDDFRTGLENYAQAVASKTPKLGKDSSLDWDENTIISWKTWGNGAAKANLTLQELLEIPDLIRDSLQSKGWENTDGKVVLHVAGRTPQEAFIGATGVDQFEAVVNAEPNQILGCYMAPFNFPGFATLTDETYPGSGYTYQDIALKDDNGNILEVTNLTGQLKKGLDPTHPGTLDRIAYLVNDFIADGYQYMRTDFLQYGIMEANFYDQAITTGVQAYNFGMQYLHSLLQNKMHVNSAIGPYFPHQYSHSMRISGDTKYAFDTIEYELNALAGGWWMGNGVLHNLLDPGDVDFNPNPASEEPNVSYSQVNAAVVTGFCQTSDDLNDVARFELTKKYFSDPEVQEVLNLGKAFKPLNITSTSTPNVFYHKVAVDTTYVGIFNHNSSNSKTIAINIDEIINTTHNLEIMDLWSNDTVVVSGNNEWSLDLEAKESRLYKIYPTNNGITPEDVYLVIGQSNAAGRGDIESQDMVELEGAMLFNGTDWEPASNPMNAYSTIRHNINFQKLGFSYTFAREIHENTSKTVGMVVNAQGGSSLEKWEKGSVDGFFESTLARLNEALAKGGTLKGILWHQGEANRNDTDYLNRLAVFISDWRTAVGIPDLPFIAGQISQDRVDNAYFNTNIKTLPGLVSNTDYVSSENLGTSDNTHFDSEGNRVLGERYAEKILQKVYGIYTNPIPLGEPFYLKSKSTGNYLRIVSNLVYADAVDKSEAQQFTLIEIDGYVRIAPSNNTSVTYISSNLDQTVRTNNAGTGSATHFTILDVAEGEVSFEPRNNPGQLLRVQASDNTIDINSTGGTDSIFIYEIVDTSVIPLGEPFYLKSKRTDNYLRIVSDLVQADVTSQSNAQQWKLKETDGYVRITPNDNSSITYATNFLNQTVRTNNQGTGNATHFTLIDMANGEVSFEPRLNPGQLLRVQTSDNTIDINSTGGTNPIFIFEMVNSQTNFTARLYQEQSEEPRGISGFPVPIVDELTIDVGNYVIQNATIKISLMDLSGKVVKDYKKDIINGRTTILFDEIPSGVYLLKINNIPQAEVLRVIKN